LGVVSVRGRMRSPLPAAKTSALAGTKFGFVKIIVFKQKPECNLQAR